MNIAEELFKTYSHTGSVGPQQNAEEQITILLSRQGKDTGMAGASNDTKKQLLSTLYCGKRSRGITRWV
jgi:hypothetical protein